MSGSVLALLGFAGLSMFPIDGWGAALIVLAFLLLGVEAAYVRHRIVTAGAAAAMAAGAMNLIDSGATRVHAVTAWATSIPLVLVTSFLFAIAIRARRNKSVMVAEATIS